MTLVIVNNNIYGMTGGQYSPATNEGDFTTTSPYGMMETSFDISSLCIGAGASFVARTHSANVPQMIDLIIKAAKWDGFSVVEIISTCPTFYGRFNKKGNPTEMLNQIKKICVPIAKYNKLSDEEKENKISTGILESRERREFLSKYRVIQKKSKEMKDKPERMKFIKIPKLVKKTTMKVEPQTTKKNAKAKPKSTKTKKKEA